MSTYIGRHAGLYDVFYADKPYAEEAAFVHQCLQRYNVGTTRRLLELACGTGTHALEFEKFGYEIIATDYSKDMLACAQRKAAEVSSSVDFRWQDMRSLDIAERPFDAVICLFDSIGYVQTDEAIKEVLCGVRKALRVGGLFIFEFWHAPAMLRSFEPVRVRRWEVPHGELVRISETQIDYLCNLARVEYTIFEPKENGSHVCHKDIHVNRFFSLSEMERLLDQSHLSLVSWFAGFDEKTSIDGNTWHIVAVAQKAQL